MCVHRLRQGLVEERMALISRLRGLLTEFGLVAPLSPEKLRRKLARCQDPEDTHLPVPVRRLAAYQLAALDHLEVADNGAVRVGPLRLGLWRRRRDSNPRCRF